MPGPVETNIDPQPAPALAASPTTADRLARAQQALEGQAPETPQGAPQQGQEPAAPQGNGQAAAPEPAPQQPPEPAHQRWERMAELDRENRELRQQLQQRSPLSRDTLAQQLADAGLGLDEVLDALAGADPEPVQAPGVEGQAPLGQPQHVPSELTQQVQQLTQAVSALLERDQQREQQVRHQSEVQAVQQRVIQHADEQRWPVLRALPEQRATPLVLDVLANMRQHQPAVTYEQAADAVEEWLIDEMAPLYRRVGHHPAFRPTEQATQQGQVPHAPARAQAAPTLDRSGGHTPEPVDPRQRSTKERMAAAAKALGLPE